jgi:ABC-type hemin transport system substrate-binding protein
MLLFCFPDKWSRSKGAVLRETLNEDLSLEAVRDKWSEIRDMSDPDSPDSVEEAMGKLLDALRVQENGAALQNVTRATLSEIKFPETKVKYNINSAILYALGGRDSFHCI